MGKAKRIALIGSTGSIGQQTLEVVSALNGEIEVVALTCNSKIDVLRGQVAALNPKPKFVVVTDPASYNALKGKLDGTKVLSDSDGIREVCEDDSVDTVVNANVGIAGLKASLEAIRCGKELALANKETLVTAGHLVMESAKKRNVRIIPIDSEHSAIFQCLQGNQDNRIEKILLTCSGGPFRGRKRHELSDVSFEQARKHPRWDMGDIITIKSASLANKGDEVIEAHWLFGLKADQIEVVIHPESTLHSGVQYADGSIIAQLGAADMRVPIQYALTYPRRPANKFRRIDLPSLARLNFESPDTETFKSLKLAYDALGMGGTAGAVLNGSNERTIELFREKRIGFLQMGDIAEQILSEHTPQPQTLENVMAADEWARSRATEIAGKR